MKEDELFQCCCVKHQNLLHRKKLHSAQLTDGIQMHLTPRYNSECNVDVKI